MKQHDIDRFWAKVDTTGECWIWLGTVSRGHCVMSVGPCAQYAVRIAWELVRGTPPPPRTSLRRTCDNALCVSPDHRQPFIARPKADVIKKQRAFTDTPAMGATYYILNRANNRIYIGMTNDLQVRFRSHWSSLNNNYHQSSALQSDWNEYGRDAFEFGMLVEGCYPNNDAGKWNDRKESFEDVFVRVYQSDDPQYGYNIGHFEGRNGLAFTHLQKIQQLRELWNIGGRRSNNEVIRRCIDYTYQQLFGQEPRP